MEIRIGVTNTPKEIDVELPERTDPDEVVRRIEESLASEAGVLWLTDRRGRRVGVPVGKVAYVELDIKGDERRVGFGVAVK